MWNGNLLRSLRDTLSSLTLRPLQEVLKRGVCGEMCVCKGGGGEGQKSISMFLQLRLIYLGVIGRKTVDGATCRSYDWYE